MTEKSNMESQEASKEDNIKPESKQPMTTESKVLKNIPNIVAQRYGYIKGQLKAIIFYLGKKLRLTLEDEVEGKVEDQAE